MRKVTKVVQMLQKEDAGKCPVASGQVSLTISSDGDMKEVPSGA